MMKYLYVLLLLLMGSCTSVQVPKTVYNDNTYTFNVRDGQLELSGGSEQEQTCCDQNIIWYKYNAMGVEFDVPFSVERIQYMNRGRGFTVYHESSPTAYLAVGKCGTECIREGNPDDQIILPKNRDNLLISKEGYILWGIGHTMYNNGGYWGDIVYNNTLYVVIFHDSREFNSICFLKILLSTFSENFNQCSAFGPPKDNYYVNCDILNVRKSPALDGEVVDSITNNQPVLVVLNANNSEIARADTEKWKYVLYTKNGVDKYGWVYGVYLSPLQR